MITMHTSEAAALVAGAHHGADVTFSGCVSDSRAVERDALFVAIRGPRFDGHEFVAEAARRGAAAAMVERVPRAGGGADAGTLVEVADSRRAMGVLAGAWRERFTVPVIAVTGSNGKTTVKEMLAATFRERGPVLATRGNLNNEIGVPLTLCRLGAAHRAAVIEMGANHAGEIAWLTEITRPTVGLVTQCGPAHLEGFGSIEGVARAKGELFAGLPADATAVINADDAFSGLWHELAGGRRVVTFGATPGADVSGTWRSEAEGLALEMATPAGRVRARLALPGRHNALNALAASAAALAAGLAPAQVAAGLAAVRPVRGRLELKRGAARARVIDDSYNANPLSLEAGLAVLGDCAGRRWLVLGDMGELGEDAAALHARAGASARAHGVERLYAIGQLSRHAVRSFGAGATHFEDRDALVRSVRDALAGDVTVLVKGSRAMRMERVVDALTGESSACCSS